MGKTQVTTPQPTIDILVWATESPTALFIFLFTRARPPDRNDDVQSGRLTHAPNPQQVRDLSNVDSHLRLQRTSPNRGRTPSKVIRPPLTISSSTPSPPRLAPILPRRSTPSHIYAARLYRRLVSRPPATPLRQSLVYSRRSSTHVARLLTPLVCPRRSTPTFA